MGCQEPHHGVASNLRGRVYSFVLDRCHVLLVNSIECATWGHGIKEPVVQHPFYGTTRVVQNLMSLPGWEQGFVQVEGCLRDAANQVVGLQGLDCDVHPDFKMKPCTSQEALLSATLVEAF